MTQVQREVRCKTTTTLCYTPNPTTPAAVHVDLNDAEHKMVTHAVHIALKVVVLVVVVVAVVEVMVVHTK